MRLGASVVDRLSLQLTLVLFLSVYSLWNLMFSPFYSAVPTLGLAVGLMFSLRSEREPSRE